MPLHQTNQPEVRVTSEKVSLSSGKLLVIDQFLLSQKTFIEAFAAAPNAKTAASFNAALVEVSTDCGFVARSPLDQLMCVSAEEVSEDDLEQLKADGQTHVLADHVLIDTRCVVFVDASLVAQADVMSEYRTVRSSRGEKAARDFLRERGAAVRYGFNRLGDSLQILSGSLNQQKCLLLKPDENSLPR